MELSTTAAQDPRLDGDFAIPPQGQAGRLEAHDADAPHHEAAMRALRHSVLYDGEAGFTDEEVPVRDAVAALFEAPVGEEAQAYSETRRERAMRGLEQFDRFTELLDRRPTEIAGDLRQVFSIFRWIGLLPNVAPVISGEWALTIPSILQLGNPDSPWIQKQLRRFDEPAEKGGKRGLGVTLLTELGWGSNVNGMQTEGIGDPAARTITLNTPEEAAYKFMPNVDTDPDRPVIGVVAARIKMAGAPEGEDEGIFPILVPMDTEGVKIFPLSDSMAAMGNAITGFNKVELPIDALLLGETAHIDEDGQFVCGIPKRQRLEKTIEKLMVGRVGLPHTVIQASADALNILNTYFADRETSRGIMIELDHIADKMAEMTSTLYVAATFARLVAEKFMDPAVNQDEKNLLAMVLKPFATYASLDILQEARERTGAAGMFRVDKIADYLHNTQGAITAEGEDQLLQISVARTVRRFGLYGPDHHLRLTAGESDGAPASEWQALLLQRESAFVTEAPDPVQPNKQNIRLGKALGARLAADALYSIEPPENIRALVTDLADVFAMGEILEDKDGWFADEGHLNKERRAEMKAALLVKKQNILEHLPALLEAFGLPESTAPIAQDDYVRGWLEHVGAIEVVTSV